MNACQYTSIEAISSHHINKSIKVFKAQQFMILKQFNEIVGGTNTLIYTKWKEVTLKYTTTFLQSLFLKNMPQFSQLKLKAFHFSKHVLNLTLGYYK